MIGGLIALKIDPTVLDQLGRQRRTVLVTGTNGKSTTTRMTTAALSTLGEVATQADGANMDAGIVAALNAHRRAPLAAIEVDELHLPHVTDSLNPSAVVLLNLSRDQLDRVGEINMIERRLRAGLAKHPATVVIANCDDVLITSIAYDHPNVVWVAAGSGWAMDATSCPRSGEPIIWEGAHWRSTGTDFERPEPDWWLDGDDLVGPAGPGSCCTWPCPAGPTAATRRRRWQRRSRSAPMRGRPWRPRARCARSRAATGRCRSASTTPVCCWRRTRRAGRRRCR